jgi:DHA2 family multidrug resistance protein
MNRPLNRGMITLSIMLATIMQTLDATIANVALPHMQGSLSASQDQIAWVLTAYIVASAIVTPLTGWLVDRFGQKNVFLVSISGFVAASALCGMSNSLAEIVAARLLQGVFGAAVTPLAQVVLLEINPREKQGPAMALWGMGVMVGPILGPTLGGWLTDVLNWRWVFFINVPIGAVAIYGIWRYIRPVPGTRRQRFDVFGFTTLSLAIAALQLMLDRGQQNDWFSSTETWIEAVGLVVMATYFVAHTATKPAGKSFVDYRLFENTNFATGLLLIFVLGLVLFASRAILPTMLQTLFNYPVLTTGLVTAPSGIGAMASMLIVGRLLGKIDLRLILFAGLLIFVDALWRMAHYSLEMSQADIIWPNVTQGVGMGLIFVPLSSGTFATLSSEMRAEGTALFSLVRNIGASVGISVMQTMLVRNTVAVHSSLTERVTYANPAWHNPAVASMYDLHTAAGAASLDGAITQQAGMVAYIDVFWLMFFMSVAAAPLLLLIRPSRRDVQPDVQALID